VKANRSHLLRLLFLDHCRRKKFFTKKDRILIAVSGGVDSMVLLDLLTRDFAAQVSGIAHVNHGLRGKSSEKDQELVRRTAQKLQIPFYTKTINARLYAKKHARSLEDACRQLRYEFLEETAKIHAFTKICTAHHADDQAETVLARIIKGTGWQGLSGVREERGAFVRPILIFSKEDINVYAKTRKIPYRIDRTNRNQVFFRNRIRHTLLPLIEQKFDAQIVAHLNHLGNIAESTQKLLRKQAKSHFRRSVHVQRGKITLEIKPFKRYFAVQQYTLLQLIFEKFIPDYSITFQNFSRISDLVVNKPSGKKLVLAGWQCIKTSKSVVFTQEFRGSPYRHFVTIGKNHRWSDLTFASRRIELPLKLKLGKDRHVEYIDERKIKGTLVIRNWENGDAFNPIGMLSTKKLSDYFIDKKIPLLTKRSIPILCERNGRQENIIWVCGYRLDNRYKITDETRSVIKLECHYADE